MRRMALLFSVLCLLLAGCGRTTGQMPSDSPQGSSEGELFHDGVKYEFEIDPKTGIIFDWNADLRE